MGQLQGVPGASQDDFDTLSDQIANILNWTLLGTKTAKNDGLIFPATAKEIFISFKHKDGYEYTSVVPCGYITANHYIYLGNSVPSVGSFCIEITTNAARYVLVSSAKKDSTNIVDGDFTLTVYYR